MSAQLLDGKKISADIRAEVKKQVEAMKVAGEKIPHLAVIMAGKNPASTTYVNHKMKACDDVGFDSTLLKFSENITEAKLLNEVQRINEDEDIDGFIVQLPLPDHISNEKVIESIDPDKDVDGFTNQNFGRIVSKNPGLLPATPQGVMELIKRYKIETKGKHAVVVGQSRIVGSPMGSLLVQQGDATVTLCHIHTQDLAFHTKQADILVVAVGKPGLISEEMVKEGAVVIDVGTTRVKDIDSKTGFRLSGDVDLENVSKKASYITPVPGGVGPMTIASLLINTVQAAKNRMALSDDES